MGILLVYDVTDERSFNSKSRMLPVIFLNSSRVTAHGTDSRDGSGPHAQGDACESDIFILHF